MIKFGIGQAVRRVEDQRFLTGQGRYVDDIALPGRCHGVNVLSPHAHARITKVDASKARAAPGVLLVLTGADVAHDHLGAFTAAMMPEDLGAPKGHRIHQQLLQSDKARFVGDRIAFVSPKRSRRRATRPNRLFHRAHDRACGEADRMDVAEICRVNLISSDKFPYNTPTWYCYDSGEFVRLLDKCIDMADWKGCAKRKTASEKATPSRVWQAIQSAKGVP